MIQRQVLTDLMILILTIVTEPRLEAMFQDDFQSKGSFHILNLNTI
jgi:hypothetical protein